MPSHTLNIRIYYEDTDAGGIVYYANYLKFCERGRTELLRAAGLENTSIAAEYGILFVVRHLEADYFSPAMLDDEIRVETAVEEMRGASFVMKQSVFRSAELLFRMSVTLVCVDQNKRPVKITRELRDGLGGYMEN